MAVFSRTEHFLRSWDEGCHHHNACPISGGAGTAIFACPCSSSCVKAPGFPQPLSGLPGEGKGAAVLQVCVLLFPVGQNSLFSRYFLSPLFLLASEKISCQIRDAKPDKSSTRGPLQLCPLLISAYRSWQCVSGIFCIRKDQQILTLSSQ